MKQPTRSSLRRGAVATAVLSSVLLPSLVASPAGAEPGILGFSGTARGNVLFVAVNVPLPVLEAGTPGTVVEISSEPLASALAMPADPGFVPRFLMDAPLKASGQKVAAACTNPESLVPTKDSYSVIPGPPSSGGGTASEEPGPGPSAFAACPALDHAFGTVSFGGLGDPKSGVRIGQGSSRAESHRLEGNAFESTAKAALSEVVLGPVTLRGLTYAARVTANGIPGGATIERSSALQEILIDGKKIAGPLDLESKEASGALEQVNAAIRPLGLTLRMSAPSRNVADGSGTAADSEASSLVLEEANPLLAGGGYTLTSALFLGRARACLNLSVEDAPAQTARINCMHL